MDLATNTTTRRNSLTSQQNIVQDIIADIYVTSDAPDEFSTFTTDISLVKGVVDIGVDVALTNASCLPNVAKNRKRCNNNKRSHSIDTLQSQYSAQSQQQQQPQLQSSFVGGSSSSTSSTSSDNYPRRPRSQSAQYGNICLLKSSTDLSLKCEDNLKEDLNEDEEYIDSLIAEYNLSQEDLKNNNSNNFNSGNVEENDLNKHEDEDDDDFTQISSFDDDCYIVDCHFSIRNE